MDSKKYNKNLHDFSVQVDATVFCFQYRFRFTDEAMPWAMCFWGFQPALFDF